MNSCPCFLSFFFSLMLHLSARSAICTNLWKTGRNFSRKLKLEIGVFKFSKGFHTCTSVAIFIGIWSLVMFYDKLYSSWLKWISKLKGQSSFGNMLKQFTCQYNVEWEVLVYFPLFTFDLVPSFSFLLERKIILIV